MKPDLHNYEAWLLDRLEGRLDPAQVAALEEFLRMHPELDPGDGPLPSIQSGGEVFDGKQDLYKQVPPVGEPNGANLDEWLAARLENDLARPQLLALDRYLYEHPEAGRMAALMAKAKVPVDAVQYPGRESLKRQLPPTGMPDSQRLTDFLIAEMEGDLDPGQVLALEKLLAADPHAARERALVRAAKVQAMPMHFPAKESLKRKTGRVVPLWTRYAAAASVLLLLGVGAWYLRHRPDEALPMAQAKPVPGAPKPAEVIVAPATSQPKETIVEVPEAMARTTAPQAAKPMAGTKEAAKPTHGVEDKANTSTAKPVSPERPTPNHPAPAVDTEPALAVHHEGQPSEPPPAPNEAASVAGTTRPTAVPQAGNSQTLGEFMANVVRNKVLDEPARQATLDGGDAWAMADKALQTVSNGRAGIKVQNGAGRDRFKFRIGRHFSISASTGH
ncbi:MAG: hypothetical protein KJZ58_06305 [Flavobacteriales bacterium]|nr:hypothetical protein [Flavobacteriales bacterium]